MRLTVIAFAFFFLILQHPFITYPLSLYLLRRFKGAVPLNCAGASCDNSVDIVFCAYNEERSITQKIENCLALKEADPALEVRAYSDGSSDATAEILSAHMGQLDIVISNKRLGKSAGMNQLLARSNADIVIFTDANTTIDANAIAAVRRYFTDPQIGCVCGNLIYVNSGESTTASVGSAYWKLEQTIKKLETQTGSTMGADGALFAIRRELFREVPVDIIDDMFTSMSILCDGYRVVQADDFIAYERSVTHAKEEFTRKVRIACRAYNCHRILWPKLRRCGSLVVYKYISHKWLRWLSGMWLGLSALFFVLATVALGYWWLGLLAVLGAIAIIVSGKLGVWAVAKRLNEVLMSFIAATVGVYHSLRGERFQTWSVATTARASKSDGQDLTNSSSRMDAGHGHP